MRARAIRFGPWQPTWGAASYGEAVERVRDAIARGDVYQVNLVQHLSATFAGDPGTVAARLGRLKPRHPEALSRQRLDGRVRFTGAVPLATRSSRLDVPDQGNTACGWRRPSYKAPRRTRPST